MKSITWKEIKHQLKLDLIGKDSYRGVTLTYSWLANQFGHFSLGFIPTLICYKILIKCVATSKPSFWAAVVISTLWFLFELYNFLGPLLSQKQTASKLLFIAAKPYKFTPAWGNVAFDTFTDIIFFCFGAFSASFFLDITWNVTGIILTLVVILLYPSFYWFLTKMYLQYALLPFQFRLSQWDLEIGETDIRTVLQFLANKTMGNHLLVFGGRTSGKTSLSVGIGTEFSIKHTTCTYTTGMKLYTMFHEPDSNLLKDIETLWTWRTAALLIIDDINPGRPVANDLVTPKMFLSMLDAPENEDNRKTIREKNIIWVLGKTDNEIAGEMTWKEMLNEIGIKPCHISSIALLDSFLP